MQGHDPAMPGETPEQGLERDAGIVDQAEPDRQLGRRGRAVESAAI
jgi:hypothetical protein